MTMKIAKKFIALAAVLMLACSCTTMFHTPARLNRFVNRTERWAEHYNLRRWEVSTHKYKQLLQDYIRNYRTYTSAEKRVAMDAIGRYHALLVKYGLKESLGVIYDLKDIIPAYAGGLKDIFDKDVSAFKDFLQDVLGMKNSDINSIVDKLQKEKK